MEIDTYNFLAGSTFAGSLTIYILSVQALQKLEECPKNLVRNSMLVMAGLSGLLMVFSINALACMNNWWFVENGNCTLNTNIKTLKMLMAVIGLMTLMLIVLSIMAYSQINADCGGDEIKTKILIAVIFSIIMSSADIFILWDDIKGIFIK